MTQDITPLHYVFIQLYIFFTESVKACIGKSAFAADTLPDILLKVILSL